ncbi:unnamed protein product [Bursaphelenchus xylophilus]|uniref:(pine wood nematode) hypothetical protein n=1 Tax=Bursaphelenchus xylophilus TaxID=6326 RepID=A0A1I7RMK9_BURXY|nr:unnamed protein product [Bursaphelenchus xylophilus]CAG9125725.1 unnamed protein product [Bursaphelenchus xylophilus]
MLCDVVFGRGGVGGGGRGGFGGFAIARAGGGGFRGGAAGVGGFGGGGMTYEEKMGNCTLDKLKENPFMLHKIARQQCEKEDWQRTLLFVVGGVVFFVILCLLSGCFQTCEVYLLTCRGGEPLFFRRDMIIREGVRGYRIAVPTRSF